MLIFHNPTELEPLLLTTFGASLKPAAAGQPIGQFGTGLKHAIATILRNGGAVRIDTHRQGEPLALAFAQESRTIRGEPLSLITINGESCSFTINLGKNWKPWMAYRELLSNAMDEGGSVAESPLSVPSGTLTTITVQWPELDLAHQNRANYFLTSKPLAAVSGLEVHPLHPTQPNAIFYRGIMVGEQPNPFRYTYNITSELKLTEDRTIAGWDLEYTLGAKLPTITDTTILRTILTAPESHKEHSLTAYTVIPTDSPFATVAQSLARLDPKCVSRIARTWLKEHNPEALLQQPIQLTAVQTTMLTRAHAFCAALGEPVTASVAVYQDLHGAHGKARPGKIMLSLSAFEMGTKFLSTTLLEEHLHATRGMDDYSRQMQDWLLQKIASLHEELTQQPL